MPRLDCNVETCRYNQEHGCTRDHIVVGGPRASVSEDTCCGSFEERRNESFRNSVGQPSERVAIQCAACNCVHNEDCNCLADCVDVAGRNANVCEDTVCGTFFRR